MQKLREYTELFEAILKKYSNKELTLEETISALQALLSDIEELINNTKLACVAHLAKLLETEVRTDCERYKTKLNNASVADQPKTEKYKSEKNKSKVTIYTDGACSGNPGRGGWCAILVAGNKEKVISGGAYLTTNNHMELTAVVSGLDELKYPCDVTIVSDSKYVCDAFNQHWIDNWIKKDTVGDRPNGDLWKELLVLTTMHNVTFEWVKGHDGHPYNERCDTIASDIAQGRTDI